MVGGFFLVDVATLDEALALAAECPAASGARSRFARSDPAGPEPRCLPPPTADRRAPMAILEATHRAIDAVWRIEEAKVIAGVARMVRDVGLAEELAQDALVAALEHWPKDGVPDNPGAWLMRTAKNRALDRLRQESLHAKQARGARRRPGGAAGARRAGLRRRPGRGERRRHRRRPAAPGVHRLPSGARDRGPGRAHPAPARRPRDRRDRARLPRARGDRRAAHRPRQAHAGRGQGAVRGARCERAGAAPRFGAGGGLPDLQRGLLGDRRRRLDAAGALRRGAASGPRSRRPRARRKRGARPGRADGAAGLARPCPGRRRRPPGAAARAGPLALGSAPDPARPRRPRALPLARRQPRSLRPAGGAGRLPCRGARSRSDRLAAHRRALCRAGRGGAVAGGRAEPRGRGRHGRGTAGRPGDRRCPARRADRSPAITCCRRCAATCSPGSAAPARRAPSSSAPLA